MNINVRLPGATPEEMTTQVVLPLEEALSTISGLDEMTSTATEGSARVTCQFVLEREIESAAQDVREKVAGALRSLPPNILPPDDPEGRSRRRPRARHRGGGRQEPPGDHRDRGQERSSASWRPWTEWAKSA